MAFTGIFRKFNAPRGGGILTGIGKFPKNFAVSTKQVVMRFSSRYEPVCSTRRDGAFPMVGRTVRSSGLPVIGLLTGLLTRCCPTSRTAAGERALCGVSPVVDLASSCFHILRAQPHAPIAGGRAHA